MSESYKNNIHDKSYRDLLSNKDTFLNLIQTFVSDTWGNKITKDNLVLVNKSYILSDYEELESDIVYKARIGGQDVFFYMVLEFQSSVDYRMPVRLLLYMIEIWREVLKNTTQKQFKRKNFRLPSIVPIVLYTGKKKWTVARSLREVLSNSELFGDSILDFKYEFIDINKYDKEELYNKKNISSAIFLLDQNIYRDEFYERLIHIVSTFNQLKEEEKSQLKHWLINVNEEEDYIENIEKIFGAKSKEEFLVMTSNISKGLERLKKDVKLEGKKEGAILARQEDIMDSLNEKGLQDEELNRIIKSQNDIEILKSWLRIVLKLDDIKKIKEEIRLFL